MAAGAALVPLPPYGVLRLDPATLVALPAFTISAATGVGSLVLTVPNAPQLLGVSVHAQAALVQSPALPRLTNAAVTTIR